MKAIPTEVSRSMAWCIVTEGETKESTPLREKWRKLEKKYWDLIYIDPDKAMKINEQLAELQEATSKVYQRWMTMDADHDRRFYKAKLVCGACGK